MTFLEQMVQQLKAEFGESISDICIVVPTRRAVVFLREAIAKIFDTTMWAPRMVSIQDFVREISGWQFPDTLPLVYELYQVYMSVMQGQDKEWKETFENFYSWGEMLVKDFDEIDKYEVDADKLFANIRDLKEIEAFFHFPEENMESIRQFWYTIRGHGEGPTEVQEKFLKIWQILFDVYSRYRAALAEKYLAYDGMAYRHITKKLAAGEVEFPYPKIVFAGFNALSTAEEKIMELLLKAEKAMVYWDVDLAYFPSDETKSGGRGQKFLAGDAPGKFIREYHSKWKALDSRLIVNDMRNDPKEIIVSGVPLQVGQARYLGNLLEEIQPEEEEMRKYAIVLADENLLFPVLYSLPEHISPLNITMGFPLRQTNMFHLLTVVGRLLRNMQQTEKGVQFAYQQVMDIVNNPFIKAGNARLSEDLQKAINKKNLVYVPAAELKTHDLSPLLAHIFSPPADSKGQIPYYDHIFRLLLEETQTRGDLLEAEYVFQFYTQFNQLREVLDAYRAEYSFTGFSGLFREVLQKARIPFEGEPLVGMQLMGFLETRVLDFDTIYILSSNEGNLPDTSTGNSFIPYSLRKGFGLPTFEEKDTIYAYHFYRLIQRAKEVHLIYNSVVNDSGGAKEISRYIRQIRHFFREDDNFHLREQMITTPAPYYEQPPITIHNSEEIRRILMDRYTMSIEGEKLRPYFSATSLTTYLGCPLRFYFRYVADIQEPDQVEETMEANTFGSVLHLTMESLYEPWLGKTLTPELFDELEGRLDECLEKAFIENDLGNTAELQGKNYLNRNVIRKLCQRILTQDRKSRPFQVISIEEGKKFFQPLTVDNHQFKLNGLFDRVDWLPEEKTVRIVDYKTGKVDLKKESPFDEVFADDKYKEAFQGYLYAWLYDKKSHGQRIQVGYYTARHLSDGIQLLNEGRTVHETELEEFETRLGDLIRTILREDFYQTEDESKCAYCPYKGICNRG